MADSIYRHTASLKRHEGKISCNVYGCTLYNEQILSNSDEVFVEMEQNETALLLSGLRIQIKRHRVSLCEIEAWSTGPFTPPFTRLLAPLTHSLALHCSCAPLHSFVRWLSHSLTPELIGQTFLGSGPEGDEVL